MINSKSTLVLLLLVGIISVTLSKPAGKAHNEQLVDNFDSLDGPEDPKQLSKRSAKTSPTKNAHPPLSKGNDNGLVEDDEPIALAKRSISGKKGEESLDNEHTIVKRSPVAKKAQAPFSVDGFEEDGHKIEKRTPDEKDDGLGTNDETPVEPTQVTGDGGEALKSSLENSRNSLETEADLQGETGQLAPSEVETRGYGAPVDQPNEPLSELDEPTHQVHLSEPGLEPERPIDEQLSQVNLASSPAAELPTLHKPLAPLEIPSHGHNHELKHEAGHNSHLQSPAHAQHEHSPSHKGDHTHHEQHTGDHTHHEKHKNLNDHGHHHEDHKKHQEGHTHTGTGEHHPGAHSSHKNHESKKDGTHGKH